VAETETVDPEQLARDLLALERQMAEEAAALAAGDPAPELPGH
jgi:hypothetical protein